MAAVERGRVFWLGVAFLLWLLSSSVALLVFGNQYYGEFGQDNQWLAANASVTPQTLGLKAQDGIQVVHVLEHGCVCNRAAKQHLAQFEPRYGIPATSQATLSVAAVAATGLTLPATPALLIFEQGKLLYAGPYATGPLCSVNDSLIEPIVKKQVVLTGLWLNSEAKACRCVVKRLS